MDTWDGIIIGGFGGAIAGISVWLTQLLQAWVMTRRDRRRVHNWLCEEAKKRGAKPFRSTRAIASWNNLTQDRVRYVCSVDKRIFPSTGDVEDMWGLNEQTARGT